MRRKRSPERLKLQVGKNDMQNRRKKRRRYDGLRDVRSQTGDNLTRFTFITVHTFGGRGSPSF
jgi:hypothetical protein